MFALQGVTDGIRVLSLLLLREHTEDLEHNGGALGDMHARRSEVDACHAVADIGRVDLDYR